MRDTVFARISLLVSTGHDSNYSTPIGIPFEIAATAIIILSAVVFVKGRALAAILYPTPVSIPIGITASAILSTGEYRHWRLSSLETIVLETIVLETIVFEISSAARRHCLRTY